jgi:hypothetical protein
MDNNEFDLEMVAETENFAVWRSDEEDGYLYHVELGGITLHFTSEEFEELILLVKSAD